MYVQHTRVTITVRSNDRLRRTVKKIKYITSDIFERSADRLSNYPPNTAKCKDIITINNALLKIYVEYTSLYVLCVCVCFCNTPENMRTVRSYDGLRRTVINSGILP